MKSKNIVHLLWTGGWDSTFRLLDLLLIKKKTVQPYYLILGRPSGDIEIRTMETIRHRLFSTFAKTKTLLRPTITKNKDGYKTNERIKTSFAELEKQVPGLGRQFVPLATFANRIDNDGLEMCIEKDSDGSLYNLLKRSVYSSGTIDDPLFRLKDDLRCIPLYSIFNYFTFPVLELTKLDMETISKREGFYEFLELTWFCHTPQADGTPCGFCYPCINAVKMGLGRRLPFFLHYDKERIIYIKNKSLQIVPIKNKSVRIASRKKC